MKPTAIITLLFACLLYASCKLDSINPNQSKQTVTLTKSPKDPQTQLSVVGTWKWSAQYNYGAYEDNLLNPDNTGKQETITLNADSSWTQSQNGNVINSGTFSVVTGITPGGPAVFLKMINHLHQGTQTYDNFDFNAGFTGSYACSADSLVFYGVYPTAAGPNTATERIYVK